MIAEVAPESWNGVLAELGFVDVYLTREWVEASALLEPGRPLFLRTDGAVFAAILRDEPPDVITPYGYGGPVGRGFWEPYAEWCAAGGVVATFVRFHPLYGNQSEAPPWVRVEPLAPTVAWRLDEAGDLFERMHRHHRRVVRKAVAAGIEPRVEIGPAELEPFRRLYEETMERQNASPFYLFRDEYWRALATTLRQHVVLFEAEGAGLLCLAAPPWLHYHLGASSEAGRGLGANTLLFLEAARWAQELGYTRFHLGGGVGGARDSLHEFKLRFDPAGELEMAVGKAVHDEAAYRRLSGSAATGGFFPAYRASVRA